VEVREYYAPTVHVCTPKTMTKDALDFLFFWPDSTKTDFKQVYCMGTILDFHAWTPKTTSQEVQDFLCLEISGGPVWLGGP
jgi:hypothetical protein